jgi:hypothetical protein
VQVADNAFGVTCLPPGHWENVINWAYCDIANPPKCDQYLPVPNELPISIVEQVPVIQGGQVFYQCNDPYMITSLGKYAAVRRRFYLWPVSNADRPKALELLFSPPTPPTFVELSL